MAPPTWIQAFSALLLLALNSGAQPVGRVLGLHTARNIYIRLSPIVCAVDGAAFIIRFVAYWFSIEEKPHEALLHAWRTRVDETNRALKNGSVLVIAIRVFGIILAILRPTLIAGNWTEAKWTVVWCLMYIIPYILFYTTSIYFQRSSHETFYIPLPTLEDGQAESSPNTTTIPPPSLDDKLSNMELILRRHTILLHVLLTLWALTDLIQRPLNAHILYSTSPSYEIPLFLLALPLVVAAMFLTFSSAIGVGYGTFMGLAIAFNAAMAHLPDHLQPVQLGRGGMLLLLLPGAVMYACGIGASIFTMHIVGSMLFGEGMNWMYGAIALDCLVLLPVLASWYGMFILFRAGVRRYTGVVESYGLRVYLEEDGVKLLAGVLGTVVVMGVWFALRYETSGHWMQDWHNALIVEAVRINSTVTN
jgi:hypothetical protein